MLLCPAYQDLVTGFCIGTLDWLTRLAPLGCSAIAFGPSPIFGCEHLRVNAYLMPNVQLRPELVP